MGSCYLYFPTRKYKNIIFKGRDLIHARVERQKRRTYLTGLVGGVLTALTGCLSVDILTEPNKVDLLLLNTTQQKQTVYVKIEGEQHEQIYQNSFRLAPDSQIRKADVVTGRTLYVTASVRDRPESSLTYSMSECENEQIAIHVHNIASLRLTQSTCRK